MLRKASVFAVSLYLIVASIYSQASPADNLAQAIRFKTVSEQDRSKIDYSQFDQFHQFLQETYPLVFSQLSVERINGYSLLIQWPGSNPTKQAILFASHMDVVPVEPGTEADWEYPAFDGVVADEKIYGRGTLDNKQGVIGWLEAAEQLLAEGFQPQRKLVFAFGHDEEISGYNGAAFIAKRMQDLGLHFEWMVDEGGLIVSNYPLVKDRPVAIINVGEKRYFTITLIATGEGGHSSSPPKTSTIGRLSAALAKIEQTPFPTRIEGPVAAMLEGIAPYADQPMKAAFNNLWLTGGLVGYQMSKDRNTVGFVRTTTALTMINAGVKENVIPQRAEAKINFRILPGDTPQTVVKAIRKLIDDENIEIRSEKSLPAAPVADYVGGGFKVMSSATKMVYPNAVVVPSLLFAATDSRHYIDLVDNIYRYYGVIMEPSQTKSIHGTNEFVSVDSFDKSIEIAKEIIRRGSE
ncbi:MAG: carboxypeptidase PM20D1 [Halioglobus sp.]|jgi:carboxypeptidase PM20D1